MIYAILVLSGLFIHLAYREGRLTNTLRLHAAVIDRMAIENAQLHKTVMELEEELTDHLDSTNVVR